MYGIIKPIEHLRAENFYSPRNRYCGGRKVGGNAEFREETARVRLEERYLLDVIQKCSTKTTL